jgi:hypothetical protein
LVSSWTCWWYAGGCYSQRAIISTYVILAISLGYLMKEISIKSIFIKYPIYLIIFLMVCLNLFQFWQFHKGIISSDRMTKEYYFSIFGRTSVPKGAENYLLVDRFSSFDEAKISEFNVKTLDKFDFSKYESRLKEKLDKDPADTNGYCLRMDSSNIYSDGINLKYKEITDKYYAWIKVSADFYFTDGGYDGLPSFVTHFKHNKLTYNYQTTDLKLEEIQPLCWKKYTAYYLTPEVRDINDTLSVYIWNRGTKTYYVKNLLIQALEPKD